MQKINHKAVLLTILILNLLGAGWYMAAPETPTADIQNQGAIVLMMIMSVSVYVYFNAWLLLRTRFVEFGEGFLLISGIWLLSVLPNLVFVQMALSLSLGQLGYLASFGAISAFITALILSAWRTSRSIFKG